MKIAQVVCAWPPYAGGLAVSAYRLGRLMETEHEVVNFSPANLRPWLRYGHGAFLPQLFFKLRRFDYIYLHYPFFGTAEVIWLFKLIFKKPKLIIHYHMDVKNLSRAAKILSLPSRLIRRSLLAQAEIIVTASLDYIKNSQIKNYYFAQPEKFREIPFGIDLKKFCPREDTAQGKGGLIAKAKTIIRYVKENFLKKDRTDIIFVGGLDKAHYFKGLNRLLEALAGIAAAKWRLVVVGDGDLRAGYEAQSRALGLETRVRFAGKLGDDELVRAYQDSDLLVLPATNNNEAFGIVLIEALACGLAVIASDLPGVRAVFTASREGLLARPDDAADLRRQLEKILNDPAKRREMAVAARRLAEERYGEETARAKTLNLFRPL